MLKIRYLKKIVKFVKF